MTEKISFDIKKEGLESMFTIFSIENVISYCKLHQTTGVEEYRKNAVEKANFFEQAAKLYNNFIPRAVSELYPVFEEKIKGGIENEEEKNFEKEAKKLIKVAGKIELKDIYEWREHCLGCKKANGCDEKRKGLGKTAEGIDKKVSSFSDGIIKIIKIVASSGTI